MVKIVFARNAKTIEVLEDVYSKDEAQAIAEQNRGKAFGLLSGIMKAFEKNKRQIALTGYQKRYEPFWHVIGESVQEYKRMSNYGFPVRPEVRSITFNNKVVPVAEEEPFIHFTAEDHCFEHYSKEILQSAVHEKQKELQRYMAAKRRAIRNLASLQDRNTVIETISIRASYLVNQLIKDLVKPIQADKILQEFVQINRLALMLRPIHVFEFHEEGTAHGKTIEVDAVTGDWKKGEPFISSEMRKRMMSEGVFEVGAELAATVIPGAGVAATLGKHIRKRQEFAKDVKKMKEWRQAYEAQKRRK
jgi:hypothetical protein